MAISLASTSYPALTTTFTPAPQCTELPIRNNCLGPSNCGGIAFTNILCQNPVYNCLPESHVVTDDDLSTTTTIGYLTYSPASICPMGWSTAARALDPDGVWCCPTGYGFIRDEIYCMATLTEGTAVVFSSTCDGRSTVVFGPGQTDSVILVSASGLSTNEFPASELTVTATAPAIFLITPSLSSGSNQSSIASSTSLATPSSSESQLSQGTNSSISTRAAIGASIGGTITIVLLLSLGFFLIRRHRKRRMAEAKAADDQGSPVLESGDDEDGVRKPELQGSNANPAVFQKNELDANATRSELLGDTNETRELDGNATRSELEGPTRSELELQRGEVAQGLGKPIRYELQG